MVAKMDRELTVTISDLKRQNISMLTLCLLKICTARLDTLAQPPNEQEAQLMLTTGSTRLAVSRGQQIWYHSTCNI